MSENWRLRLQRSAAFSAGGLLFLPLLPLLDTHVPGTFPDPLWATFLNFNSAALPVAFLFVWIVSALCCAWVGIYLILWAIEGGEDGA